MDRDPTTEDWKATAYAAMWFPYRRAVTHSFASFIQDCIAAFQLQRCLYIGFESPSVIDTLQRSEIVGVHTFCSFDYWHTEADFWNDQPPFNNEPSNRAFIQKKSFKVIEGHPLDVDCLYFDREEKRPEYLTNLLPRFPIPQGIVARMLILADLQEQDGPIQVSALALKHGWFRIRVADSYFPPDEANRPETFVSHIFVPDFSQGPTVVALARKHHLFVDSNQSA